MTPHVDDAAAFAASPVTVSLLVKTSGPVACTWTVSPETVVLKVTGEDLEGIQPGLPGGEPGDVWSTQVCETAIPVSDVVLQPSVDTTIGVVWRPFPGQGRGYSNRYCPGTSQWMVPGRFTAHAAAFGGEPSSFDFRLRAVRPEH